MQKTTKPRTDSPVPLAQAAKGGPQLIGPILRHSGWNTFNARARISKPTLYCESQRLGPDRHSQGPDTGPQATTRQTKLWPEEHARKRHPCGLCKVALVQERGSRPSRLPIKVRLSVVSNRP